MQSIKIYISFFTSTLITMLIMTCAISCEGCTRALDETGKVEIKLDKTTLEDSEREVCLTLQLLEEDKIAEKVAKLNNYKLQVKLEAKGSNTKDAQLAYTAYDEAGNQRNSTIKAGQTIIEDIAHFYNVGTLDFLKSSHNPLKAAFTFKPKENATANMIATFQIIDIHNDKLLGSPLIATWNAVFDNIQLGFDFFINLVDDKRFENEKEAGFKIVSNSSTNIPTEEVTVKLNATNNVVFTLNDHELPISGEKLSTILGDPSKGINKFTELPFIKLKKKANPQKEKSSTITLEILWKNKKTTKDFEWISTGEESLLNDLEKGKNEVIEIKKSIEELRNQADTLDITRTEAFKQILTSVTTSVNKARAEVEKIGSLLAHSNMESAENKLKNLAQEIYQDSQNRLKESETIKREIEQIIASKNIKALVEQAENGLAAVESRLNVVNTALGETSPNFITALQAKAEAENIVKSIENILTIPQLQSAASSYATVYGIAQQAKDAAQKAKKAYEVELDNRLNEITRCKRAAEDELAEINTILGNSSLNLEAAQQAIVAIEREIQLAEEITLTLQATTVHNIAQTELTNAKEILNKATKLINQAKDIINYQTTIDKEVERFYRELTTNQLKEAYNAADAANRVLEKAQIEVDTITDDDIKRKTQAIVDKSKEKVGKLIAIKGLLEEINIKGGEADEQVFKLSENLSLENDLIQAKAAAEAARVAVKEMRVTVEKIGSLPVEGIVKSVARSRADRTKQSVNRAITAYNERQPNDADKVKTLD